MIQWLKWLAILSEKQTPSAEEVWHHVAGLQSLKRLQERQLVESGIPVQWRSPDFGDVSSMGWPPRTATCVKWSNLERMKQEWQSWRSAPVLGPWIPEDCEWDPDSKHWIFLTVALWFCIVWIATVPWFFLHELGKHLAYFWFYGSLQLRDFGLLKKCWCLREIMDVLETENLKILGSFGGNLEF